MMPASRATASEQLARLLHIIPAAARVDGCDLGELAVALDTPVQQVLRDLEEVTTRAYYHPAGGSENLQILVEGDRVRIFTTGEFRRPLRLAPLEALALALGFRIVAGREESGARLMLLEAAARIEASVATDSAADLIGRFAVDAREQGHAEMHDIVRLAAADRRQCRIEYVRPGEPGVEPRTIHPYAIVKAEAGWYVLAHCSLRADIRVFRLDRVLSATVLDETFDVPAGFDPREWVTSDGRVYRALEEVEVAVRYSSAIAPWIREHGPVEELDDGGVVVRYRVADADWVVRHVLRHGAEAEILEPASLREAIVGLLARLGG